MRISDMSYVDSTEGNLAAAQATITALDTELSSGIALQQPSDNPVAASDAIGYQRQLALVGAATNNATTAQAWLGIAGASVNQVITTLQSAKTLVLQGLNSGSNNAQSYQELAAQVQGIVSEMVGYGNTTYGDTPIFAGTAGVTQAYDDNGDYLGNSQTFTMDVGTSSPVAVSVPGDAVFGGGTSGTQSVFTTLQNIVTDLQAGPGATSYAGLQNDLTALDANMDLAENGATTIGEASQQVSAATASLSSRSLQLQTVLSSTISTDIPTTAAALQSDMTNYQAALYAVSQAIPQSLAQFLH